MKSAISHLWVIGLLLLVTCSAFARTQEDNPLVVQPEASNKTGFPGQIFSLALNLKKGTETSSQVTQEGYEVEIIQGSIRRQVTVWRTGLFRPAPLPGKSAVLYRQLEFFMPYGLSEGDAVVAAIYQGQRSDEHHFKINARPVPVVIGRNIVSIGPSDRISPAQEKTTRQPLTLENGKENSLTLRPLFDPDDKDAELLVSIKQNEQLYSVKGQVVLHASKNDGFPASPPWEAQVSLPDRLAAGEALLEIRVRIKGVESELTTEKVLLRTSAELAEEKRRTEVMPPRLAHMDPQKASVGQVIRLLVENRTTLEPSPGNVLVIIEQDNRRYELKPIFNSALKARTAPAATLNKIEIPELAFLSFRLGPDVIGKVMIRILNPAQGSEAGLSNGLPMEIAADVIQPSNIEVTEALRNEVEEMNQQLKSARGVQPHLDTNKRYIRMRAEGLSLGDSPEIKFEQTGRVFTYSDFQNLLVMEETMYLALPDAIEPGEVIVSVANRVGDRTSIPAKVVLRITQAAQGKKH